MQWNFYHLLDQNMFKPLLCNEGLVVPGGENTYCLVKFHANVQAILDFVGVRGSNMAEKSIMR